MTPRTFLITGASKGIGLALSKRLSEQGHTVVGIARHVKDVRYPGKLIAAAIAFLLSEEAGFITGQTLFVDGGASIGEAMV